MRLFSYPWVSGYGVHDYDIPRILLVDEFPVFSFAFLLYNFAAEEERKYEYFGNQG